MHPGLDKSTTVQPWKSAWTAPTLIDFPWLSLPKSTAPSEAPNKTRDSLRNRASLATSWRPWCCGLCGWNMLQNDMKYIEIIEIHIKPHQPHYKIYRCFFFYFFFKIHFLCTFKLTTTQSQRVRFMVSKSSCNWFALCLGGHCLYDMEWSTDVQFHVILYVIICKCIYSEYMYIYIYVYIYMYIVI